MDSAQVVQFMLSLGVDDDSIIIDEDRRWVRCSCPLAPWTHASGKDSSPSFGITIRDEDDETQSVAHCYTCGRYSVDREYWKIEDVLHKFWLVSGEYPKAAAHIYASGKKSAEFDSINIPDREVVWETPDCYPYHVLKKYPKLKHRKIHDLEALSIVDYLCFHRGLSEEILDFYNVRFNSERGTMVFPLTGIDKKVYAIRERACSYTRKDIWTVSSSTLKRDHQITDYIPPKITASGAMFGLAQIDITKPVITLCEGEIDAMKLKMFGAINPLATATNQVTMSQFRNMQGYIDKLIHVPDADQAGVITVVKLQKLFSGTGINIQTVDCGLVTVKDDITLSKKKAKDAGDLKSSEQFNFLLKYCVSQEDFIKKYSPSGQK